MYKVFSGATLEVKD